MTEKEMEDLLWNYSDRFLNQPLKRHSRQQRSAVGRCDLVFTDRLDRMLVIEIKKGKLGRDAIPQIIDYFGVLKREFPMTPVELMVVANIIPEERRLTCDRHDIEAVEISEKRFRDIAAEVGYRFESELNAPHGTEPKPVSPQSTRPFRNRVILSEQETYRLQLDFDRQELDRLLRQFTGVVRRTIDKSLATNLREELLSENPPSISRSTTQQLSKWCKTNNPVYWDGMDVAKKISELLFGCVIDRHVLGK